VSVHEWLHSTNSILITLTESVHSIAQGLARDQLKTEPFRHPGANCHWIPIRKPILGRKEEYVGKGMGETWVEQ